MHRITIKDIAKLLQVTPSTVSRALKNHPDISPDTIQRVKQVAQTLGYTPNLQAIQLRKQKSGIIGMIVPGIGMFFLPSVLKAIEEACHDMGYKLVIFQSKDSLEQEVECVKICESLGVDGLLVSVSLQTKDVSHLLAIQSKGIPVVIFDRNTPDNHGIPTVLLSDYQTSYDATLFLQKKQYTPVGGIFGNSELAITGERLRGFSQCLQDHNQPDNLIVFGSNIPEVKAATLALLNRPDRPRSLFVMSDECLAGAMQAVYELKLHIPQDLAIICISDGEVPYMMAPPVSYVWHSGFEIGRKAISLLMEEIIAGKPLDIRVAPVFIDTFLYPLAST